MLVPFFIKIVLIMPACFCIERSGNFAVEIKAGFQPAPVENWLIKKSQVTATLKPCGR